jgi:hypothetical protein
MQRNTYRFSRCFVSHAEEGANDSEHPPIDKILADWAVRESRELDAAVADWRDLDQLIQALETPWIFIFPKLTQAFKATGDRAIEALIAAHSRPAGCWTG